MKIVKLTLIITFLTTFGFSNVLAGDLRDLEDVTVRVIDLDEVPGDGVQLIDLPEPDLGELHDNMEAVNFPGRGVVSQHGNGDIAGRQGDELAAPESSGGNDVPNAGAAPTQPVPQPKPF